MTAVYRIAEKKCATCRWWNGERGIEFRAYKPYYVKVDTARSPCMAKPNTAFSFLGSVPKTWNS